MHARDRVSERNDERGEYELESERERERERDVRDIKKLFTSDSVAGDVLIPSLNKRKITAEFVILNFDPQLHGN